MYSSPSIEMHYVATFMQDILW